MEQHGVRAYLSFVGTGELVLLHVWPMDAVDDGVYWVGSDSSTVGLSGPAGPESGDVGCFCHPAFGGGDRRSFMDAFPPCC